MIRRAAALLAALACATPAAAEPPRKSTHPPRHVDLAPSGPSLEARLLEIRRRVQAAASYPESARLRGVSGEAFVAFRIGPDGRPLDIGVVRSSGSVALDRAAARAVRDAGALPRVLGRVNVPVRFALVAPD